MRPRGIPLQCIVYTVVLCTACIFYPAGSGNLYRCTVVVITLCIARGLFLWNVVTAVSRSSLLYRCRSSRSSHFLHLPWLLLHRTTVSLIMVLFVTTPPDLLFLRCIVSHDLRDADDMPAGVLAMEERTRRHIIMSTVHGKGYGTY